VAESKATLLISSSTARHHARVAAIYLQLGCILSRPTNTPTTKTDTSSGDPFESLRQPISELSKTSASMASLLPWSASDGHLFDTAKRDRVVIMVSRLPHCMMDLLSGIALASSMARVHHQQSPEVNRRGPFEVPFKVIPVSKIGKSESEKALLEKLDELNAIRRPRALYASAIGRFLRAWTSRCQYPSCFPSRLAGPAATQAAHDRGVKLIGATAHT